MISPSKPKQQHQVFHCTNSQTPSSHQKWQVGAKKQTIVFSNAIQEHFSRSLLGLFLKFYAIVHFWCQNYLAIHLISGFVSSRVISSIRAIPSAEMLANPTAL